MTFRTRLFPHVAGCGRAHALVATVLVSWSVRGATERAHRALARQPGAARRRNAVSSSPAGRELDAEADAHRPLSSRARDLHRRRRRGRRRLGVSTPNSSRRSRTTAAVRRSSPRAARARRRADAQRDARHRHALRRGAGAQPAGAGARRRAPRAAADRGRPPARRGAAIALIAFAVGLLAALALAWATSSC